ncbi:MAG TPA: DNA ligase (NAD(+)) LigA, partial [Rikenellaceae bacterium]|nr:DNA ligase (NAD(+)) LigA [Rikenellaceae bacterium]
LYDAGLQMAVAGKADKTSDALSGKTIVVSGNFSISRDDMKALIEANGGKNGSSVSSKTSYLLAGSKPGPEKVKKANELGIQIIDEKFLYDLIGSPEGTVSAAPIKKADGAAETAPSVEPSEPTLF